MKQLKAALIGFGGMGHCHAAQYSGQKDIQLVAICDISQDALNKPIGTSEGDCAVYASAFKCTSFEELLEKCPDFDYLDICLPTYLHKEYAIRAMRAGYHVLCEKPMALSTADCNDMIAVSYETGKFLMIAQCLRFCAQYIYIKELIDSQRYGKLLSISMQRNNGLPKGWFQDEKLSGGALMDLHLHDIDFLQFALGMPKSVYSIGVTAGSGGIDDCTTIYYYPNDLKTVASGGWAHTKFSSAATAIFEKSNFELIGNELSRCYRNEPTETIEFPADTPNMYFREIEYFGECIIKGERPSISSIESTRDSITLIEKELESIKTGRKLDL
ncbi:MAG: Gfo/Idh/MocA family oxidoreductase [Lentisphaeria bacterium]|nr:Gfo/Idh/MocA family oxidoreductase [Lentisphaeria bacterium]